MREPEELTSEEQALVVRLRALPSVGTEPDWNELERSIRNAVGPTMPSRPWWRRWQWVVPIAGLAATAAIAAIWLARTPQPAPPAPAPNDVAHAAPTPAPAEEDSPELLWLDGHVVDVGAATVDDLAPDSDALATDDSTDDSDVPAGDLGWVDSLDDKAVERAEHWLARKKS